MAIEQQSAAVGAVGEKGVGVLSRSQTTRLPDRAATAALYMTHPDRRLSVREPAIADAQLLRDSTATANWRLDLSHASASAALAHTRSKPIEVWRPKAQPAAERAAFHARDFPAPDAIYVAKPTPESHLAAASAIRDRRSIISTPPAPLEMEPEQLADLQRRASQREKALLAATGAYNPSRKRAGTAPSKPSASVSQRPLAASAAGASREAAAAEPLEPTIVDDFPPSVEASRIQHVTNTDPQLYTSHPPVEGEEEQRKKNVQQAAVVSMARDMYDITEAKGEAGGKPSPAVSAAQRGQTRMQPRKAPNQRDPAAVKQAIGLQEAAQKRAQEKLALMHNEAAAFQEYYGTAPQPARGLGSRKRRTSSDTDVEQSKEIRKQMSSLRFKLNTVDEKRERDRHLLMEAARRNVDAAIHDMEKKVYYDTGRAPSSLQREWEQEAEQRMKKEQQETVEQQQQQQQPDKVNIGAEQFVNMSDVEATARSRVQPTLDEINENADEYQDKLEADRAREMEERLDQERQKGLQSTQRQRESDLKAEEKRLKDYLKHENKEGKTEKSRLFGKRSKRSSKGAEPATEKAEATGAAGGTTTGAAKETEAAGAAKDTETAAETAGAAKDTETAGAAKDTETTGAAKDTEIAGAAGGAGATGATGAGATGAPAPVAAVEAPADEGPSSGEEIPEMYPSQGVEGENELVTAPPQEQKVTPKSESKFRNWFRKSRGSRRSSVPDEPQPKEERAPREPDRRASAAEDAAVRVREDSRGAALASHPITGEELDEMQRRRSVASTTEENAGQSVAKDSSGDQRRSSFFRRSNLKKMVSRNGHEPKTNGAPEQTEGTAAAAATGDAPASPSILHRASIPEREDLRDYAAEQGLPVPPAGIGKQTSHGTRESRFSEDL